MIELDKIYLGDCLTLIKEIPDKSIDLVLTDPPYQFKDTTGAGAFGTCRGKSAEKKGRTYHAELEPMADGVTNDILNEMCRVCKIPNIYLFCNKDQIPQYLNYALEHKLNFDILTWHKPNPTPMCGNKYLSDTEYIIFLRGKGAKVYGTYETKRKWYVQNVNREDKKRYNHATVKPLNIVRNLLINSTLQGGVILDAFIGSGTTAVAAIREGRHFIGFEIDENHYKTACERINEEKQRLWNF